MKICLVVLKPYDLPVCWKLLMSDVDNSAIDACPAPAWIEVATTPSARLYHLPTHAAALGTILPQRK